MEEAGEGGKRGISIILSTIQKKKVPLLSLTVNTVLALSGLLLHVLRRMKQHFSRTIGRIAFSRTLVTFHITLVIGG